ncbi:exopolysaccharide biosynthesis protein [Wolbachia endosymbiont of Litomosoides sigmodontis]|uniref:exopolysaccharide biosynthesis protein n=1 Tax=Wolbachia endosymbiont of Litomosoides sigmodontis TaxID=80850 RepID=UPI001589C035|nr:exopolysaccharide biosynthesis protein [Wolbachia endosymbiont of Litomosoides sigmodontis]QKX02883.1 exopolysaccharide biosynthesis protein [Wolbachia endosymbiont of Litomosoides sigmodontis]
MQKSEKLATNKKLASDLLKEVVGTNNADSDKVTLFDIKVALQERGFGILIIIFSLPLSVPIPVPPGYTTIFSIPLILFALQLLFGFHSPWMPHWLEGKSFQRSTLALVVKKTSPALRKVEKFMRPRMSFIFYGPGEKILAFIMLFCALSIAIPLPLTNFIPAIGTTLISLGIVSKDGLFSILGVLVSLCGLLLTFVVLVKGPQLMLGAFSFLKSFVYG